MMRSSPQKLLHQQCRPAELEAAPLAGRGISYGPIRGCPQMLGYPQVVLGKVQT